NPSGLLKADPVTGRLFFECCLGRCLLAKVLMSVLLGGGCLVWLWLFVCWWGGGFGWLCGVVWFGVFGCGLVVVLWWLVVVCWGGFCFFLVGVVLGCFLCCVGGWGFCVGVGFGVFGGGGGFGFVGVWGVVGGGFGVFVCVGDVVVLLGCAVGCELFCGWWCFGVVVSGGWG
ncbi:hypothetical protein, partial [Pseudomonas syringae group genomosp. 7]|uniref:hypothetical protein n=1 Tax=Pseudomonas syringae group genomosp. 7 TaxID=251699 RepID=UPI0037700B72